MSNTTPFNHLRIIVTKFIIETEDVIDDFNEHLEHTRDEIKSFKKYLNLIEEYRNRLMAIKKENETFEVEKFNKRRKFILNKLKRLEEEIRKINGLLISPSIQKKYKIKSTEKSNLSIESHVQVKVESKKKRIAEIEHSGSKEGTSHKPTLITSEKKDVESVSRTKNSEKQSFKCKDNQQKEAFLNHQISSKNEFSQKRLNSIEYVQKDLINPLFQNELHFEKKFKKSIKDYSLETDKSEKGVSKRMADKKKNEKNTFSEITTIPFKSKLYIPFKAGITPETENLYEKENKFSLDSNPLKYQNDNNIDKGIGDQDKRQGEKNKKLGTQDREDYTKKDGRYKRESELIKKLKKDNNDDFHKKYDNSKEDIEDKSSSCNSKRNDRNKNSTHKKFNKIISNMTKDKLDDPIKQIKNNKTNSDKSYKKKHSKTNKECNKSQIMESNENEYINRKNSSKKERSKKIKTSEKTHRNNVKTNQEKRKSDSNRKRSKAYNIKKVKILKQRMKSENYKKANVKEKKRNSDRKVSPKKGKLKNKVSLHSLATPEEINPFGPRDLSKILTGTGGKKLVVSKNTSPSDKDKWCYELIKRMGKLSSKSKSSFETISCSSSACQHRKKLTRNRKKISKKTSKKSLKQESSNVKSENSVKESKEEKVLSETKKSTSKEESLKILVLKKSVQTEISIKESENKKESEKLISKEIEVEKNKEPRPSKTQSLQKNFKVMLHSKLQKIPDKVFKHDRGECIGQFEEKKELEEDYVIRDYLIPVTMEERQMLKIREKRTENIRLKKYSSEDFLKKTNEETQNQKDKISECLELPRNGKMIERSEEERKKIEKRKKKKKKELRKRTEKTRMKKYSLEDFLKKTKKETQNQKDKRTEFLVKNEKKGERSWKKNTDSSLVSSSISTSISSKLIQNTVTNYKDSNSTFTSADESQNQEQTHLSSGDSFFRINTKQVKKDSEKGFIDRAHGPKRKKQMRLTKDFLKEISTCTLVNGNQIPEQKYSNSTYSSVNESQSQEQTQISVIYSSARENINSESTDEDTINTSKDDTSSKSIDSNSTLLSVDESQSQEQTSSSSGESVYFNHQNI